MSRSPRCIRRRHPRRSRRRCVARLELAKAGIGADAERPPRISRRSIRATAAPEALRMPRHIFIDYCHRICYELITLLGDGRFARRLATEQGRRPFTAHDLDRASARRGEAPGGAPPSASPSRTGNDPGAIRRGVAAPEAQKVVTPTAWRGSRPSASRRFAPAAMAANLQGRRQTSDADASRGRACLEAAHGWPDAIGMAVHPLLRFNARFDDNVSPAGKISGEHLCHLVGLARDRLHALLVE
jgi:hypothetical protein